VRLVFMPGQQDLPAISPDGKQVAFEYSGGGQRGIYIALVGGEKPLQLTKDFDGNPAWSPDGRQIAFVRYSDPDQKKIYVVPAFGGSERHVYTTSLVRWDQCNQMSWSPDGKSLIFSENLDNNAKARLIALSLSDSTARPLTFPANQQLDCDPSSPPTAAGSRSHADPWALFLATYLC
jgi:Tol biopolymer transport system component